MTYANDCIQMRDHDKRASLKRIEKHSRQELNAAIEAAHRKFGDDFWLLLHGIDAYMERRKRHHERRGYGKLTIPLDQFMGIIDDPADMWGNS